MQPVTFESHKHVVSLLNNNKVCYADTLSDKQAYSGRGNVIWRRFND